MKSLASLLSILCVLLFTSAAFAGWTHDVNYEYANSTSLKITGTEGLYVVVEANGNVYEDTTPAIINLDDVNTYIQITVEASDGGDAFSKKIEVKEFQQTVLTLSYQAEAKTDTKTTTNKGRNYVGTLYNSTNWCTEAPMNVWLRYDLMDADGEVAFTQEIEPNTFNQSEIEEGTYDVRVYSYNGTSWTYVATVDFVVEKDGFEWGYGCAHGDQFFQR